MKLLPAIAAAALLCLCASACATGSRPSTAAGCSISHATRVAADRYGSILSVPRSGGDRVFYACPRHGAAIALGHQRCLPPGAGRGVTQTRLAGRYVAYSVARCGIDSSQAGIRVLDIRRRRLVLDAAALGPPFAPETVESVAALRVRPDGAAAWVADAHSLGTHGSKRELWTADSRHALRRLDSGAAIDPRSLRLHAGSLSWRHGGAPRSASLG